jgi:hypothetical protein
MRAGFVAAQSDLILFQDNDVQLMSGCIWFPRALLVAPRVLYAHNLDVVEYDSADFSRLWPHEPAQCERPAALAFRFQL